MELSAPLAIDAVQLLSNPDALLEESCTFCSLLAPPAKQTTTQSKCCDLWPSMISRRRKNGQEEEAAQEQPRANLITKES